MLGTYFVLILAMFIVMVVGAVLGYTGNKIGAQGTYKDSLDFRVKIKFCGHSPAPKSLSMFIGSLY